ncbi:MAG TPA: hypothetical protein VK253_06070, partial [Candidatus Binatia bacterium]|nr:hypothetical protein [Candidatus Binatia bacterium]
MTAVIEKYSVSILLLLLTAVSFVGGYAAVFTALVFTFLVPGLIAYKFFNLKTHEIWAFVPVFSVLVSVQLVYYLSLSFGYSRNTILLSFLALTAVYILAVYKKGEPLKPAKFLKIKQFKKTTLLLFTAIFIISFAVLVRSVWYGNSYGIVLTGSNWQDTPLHYEIIESINNGNFPPQMPNFAGYPETYHYFVDFHTSILEKMFGYLPTLLPFLNAVFIFFFALAMYALARSYGRKVAVIATVLGVFGWGLSYFGLFSALFNGQFNSGQNYIFQYGGTFGLPSVFDNLLQQRPMLVGLPAFALVMVLLRNMDDKRRILLAGVVTGLVFEFHNVAFFCCYVAYVAFVIFNFKRFNLSYLYFLIPTALVLPFILEGGPPLTVGFSGAWIANFAQNPFIYYPLNLGIPFVLAIASFFWRGHEELKITFLFLMLIPNVVLLTPNPWDMYKFFMFAWIPIAVLSSVVLSKLWVRKWRVVVLGLVLLSIITSVSVVIFNVGTEYPGASWSEYQIGLWVKDNTPQNSVFLTYYSIHAPSSMIGGRLRVSSYINWPYGHGVPLDQVFHR